MNDRQLTSLMTLSIAAVERDTGLSKDTLRVWERRYGFPTPDRDGFGERVYSLEQVDKLRIIRRLMDLGLRPGRIINQPIEALHQLAAELTPTPQRATDHAAPNDSLREILDMIKRHELDEVRRVLGQKLARLGLARFVIDVAAPMNDLVGEAWARGYFEIFEEHLYSEQMQTLLRQAIMTIPSSTQRPRVLLTTIPQEPHGLGLLMVEALLALEGCRCQSLGTQTPLWDIVLAARAQQADIVALSFSAALNPNHVLDSLAELRSKLPESTEIWAGGRSSVLSRRGPKGVQVIQSLPELSQAMQDWRDRQLAG